MGHKVLRIMPGVLVGTYVTGNLIHCRIVEGLPKDARLVAVRTMHEFEEKPVELLLESQEWPDVAEGNPYEPVEIIIERIWDKKDHECS